MKPFDVPEIWQHLPFHRGYPVPYFVYWEEKDGIKVPNFHIADGKKWAVCLKYKKCWVCGKPLKNELYMVTGPKGLKNCVGTDTFMHEACARESIRLCPHLLYQKTARRDPDTDQVIVSPHFDMNKPEEIILVRSGQWQIITTGHSPMINYQPLAAQWFHYVDGLLTARTEKLERVEPSAWRKRSVPVIPISQL